MPALLDFSISFVVNDTAELEVDIAPAPSLCLRKQCGCGWAVYRLAWRQRAQRAHEEHVILSMDDFDEQPNKKEQDTSSSVTCRCLLAARAHDAWRKTDELFQVSARHLGVWNFRRIVFHASLQVESSCYRFFLCWSPLTSVNAIMARVAPFVHGSHVRGRGRSFAPQSVRQKQTNGRQRTFVRKKSSFVKISNE